MTDYKNLKQFKKSEVNGLTKYLANFQDYSARDNSKFISRAEELGLELDYNDSNLVAEKFIFKQARKITKEQTERGKAWLKNHFYKLNGKPRSGQATEHVSDEVLSIAKSVSRFEFIGVLGVMNSFGTITQVLPIYRTYNRKGQYFDYAPIHWGQPVIMEG